MNAKRHAASLLLGVLLAACAGTPASPTPPVLPAATSPTPQATPAAAPTPPAASPPTPSPTRTPGPTPSASPMLVPPSTPVRLPLEAVTLPIRTTDDDNTIDTQVLVSPRESSMP